MNFDVDTLNKEGLILLNEAIKRTAPKVRFWYHLPSTRFLAIDRQEIIEQTKATSDFDKLQKKHSFITQDEYNSRRFHSSPVRSERSLRNFLGFKDWELCVHNPQEPTIALSVGRKKAKLIQIDGITFRNTYEGRINFEGGYAVINESDQDIAHGLGLMFTPAGILEVDALTTSDPEMNRNKTRQNGLELYCDNRACQKQIRNPVLVVDDRIGGTYHSLVCYEKDIGIKRYLGVEGYSPREVPLSEAQEMLRKGLLQQSPDFKGNTLDIRSLKPWPEAAIILRH